MTVNRDITTTANSPLAEQSGRQPSSYVRSEFDKQLWSDLRVAAFIQATPYIAVEAQRARPQ